MTQKLPEDCRESRGYGAVGRFAVAFWAVVFAAVIVIAAVSFLGSAVGSHGSDAVEPHAPAGGDHVGSSAILSDPSDADRTTGIVERFFPGTDVSVDIDRGSGLDVRLFTGSTDVRLRGLGGGDDRQVGAISHGAIDEGVARSSGAGLCAAGLTDPAAPVSLEVNARNGSVRADLSSEPSEPRARNGSESPAETVLSCRSGSDRAE